MNTIEWKNRARKQWKRLPRTYQKLILDAVDTLEEPVSVWKNVLNLKNHAYQYRMRVGRYRILFDFDGSVQVVEIQEVRKRDERTY